MALALGALAGCGQPEAKKAEVKPEAKPAAAPAVTEIHIPVIAPLSGPQASGPGKAAQDGAGLAAKLINDKGGIKGQKLVLDWYDDRGDASEAAVLAQKVADNKNYAAVIAHFSSDACFAAMPIYEKAGLPMLTAWASHVELTTRSKISFRMSGSTAAYGQLNGDIIVDELKAKKVGIILANAEYHKDHTKYMKERFTEKKVQIVKEEFYMIGDSDFKPQLTNIIKAAPDVIAIVGYPREVSFIINQARTMGWKKPLTISPGAASQETIDLAGKNMTDTYMGASSSALTDALKGKPVTNKAAADYLEGFRKEYKKDPAPGGGWEAQSFDVVRVIAQAITKVGNDRAKVLQELTATKDFQGVLGVLFGPDRAMMGDKAYNKFDPKAKEWVVFKVVK
jgi:branched-chain amino acid transport system substrate-binding protein